jgi:hypothetical protein
MAALVQRVGEMCAACIVVVWPMPPFGHRSEKLRRKRTFHSQ